MLNILFNDSSHLTNTFFLEFDLLIEVQIKHILLYEVCLDPSWKLGLCLFWANNFFLRVFNTLDFEGGPKES